VPPTVFYDWLYLTAIHPHREWLTERLTEHEMFAGFTDIEFNPSKSINCQARSCALFVALIKRDLFEDAIQSPESFIETMREGYQLNPSVVPDADVDRVAVVEAI
jgi:hypothetical protein